MIDSKGKLFGLINVIDFALILVVIAIVGGYLMVKSGAHKTSAQVVKNKAEIEIDIFSRGQKMLKPDSLFKGEKKSFLTIRNVPYTALEVVNWSCQPWQVPVLHPESNTAVSIDDPSAPFTEDCMLTLKDIAEVTDDGYVIGGNKIKVGLRVDIEGFNYRLPAVVADVRKVKDL
ncbi:MAG: DUF4330 domain-containing protein [Cyanobacteriota bacterium]